MTKRTAVHPLVDAYLHRLDRASRVLPRAQRRELSADIEAHLLAAIDESDGSEAGIRNAIDALGSPESIVDSAGPPGPGVLLLPRFREVATVALLLFGGVVVPVIGWVVGAALLWSSPAWSTRHKIVATLVWPGGLLGGVALVGLGASTGSGGCTSGATAVPVPASIDSVPASAATTVAGVPSSALHCVSTGGTGLAGWATIVIVVAVLVPPVVVAISLLRSAGRSRVALPGPGPVANFA